jgi:hypothetical protein
MNIARMGQKRGVYRRTSDRKRPLRRSLLRWDGDDELDLGR